MMQFGLFFVLFIATAIFLGKYLRFRFASSKDRKGRER
jgi:hypothetical protein